MCCDVLYVPCCVCVFGDCVCASKVNNGKKVVSGTKRSVAVVVCSGVVVRDLLDSPTKTLQVSKRGQG